MGMNRRQDGQSKDESSPRCPVSLPKAGCYMKSFIVLVFLLVLGAGYCSAGGDEVYVSKENPQYTVRYYKIESNMTEEMCRDYSRERPDAIFQCNADSHTFIFSVSSNHYYQNGEIIDDQMDNIAERSSLRQLELEKLKATSKNVVAYIIIFLVVCGILGIIAYILWGYGQLKVFSSIADVLLTLILPVVVFLVGGVLINIITQTNASALGNYFAWGTLFTWIAINFIMAFSNNKNPFYGFLAFTGRIMMPIFIVFLFSWISNLVNNGRNRSFTRR